MEDQVVISMRTYSPSMRIDMVCAEDIFKSDKLFRAPVVAIQEKIFGEWIYLESDRFEARLEPKEANLSFLTADKLGWIEMDEMKHFDKWFLGYEYYGEEEDWSKEIIEKRGRLFEEHLKKENTSGKA